jgi:hypothetical protein
MRRRAFTSQGLERAMRADGLAPGRKWRNKRTKRVCTVLSVGVHVVEYFYDRGALSTTDRKFTVNFTREG